MQRKIPFTNIYFGRPDAKKEQVLEEIVKQANSEVLENVRNEKVSKLPVSSGGRESVPDGLNLFTALVMEATATMPDYDIRFLDSMQHLATYNADFSYAVDNIVQLGNTDWDVFFEDDVQPEKAAEMIKLLKRKGKSWYTNAGGLDSLINDLLAQIAITGAISSEIIPANDLSGVKKVVLVGPKKIRFLYDVENDDYTPYQVVSEVSGKYVGDGGLKKLNQVTYKYIALRRFSEKPYAIPPFLSALENIAIERDMLKNFQHIVKQIGVFGFLQVLMSAPTRNLAVEPHTTDGDAKYMARCTAYLNTVTPELEKSLSNGYVVGFKNAHEFKMEGNISEAQGAKLLFELNDNIKMSGLKQDPLMLGRNYSVTETVGRVIIAKLGNQVVNYQKLVAAFLEQLFLVELQLAEYPVFNLDVVFAKPMLGDQVKEEQAYTAKIANADALYKAGVIDQQKRAQMLGYEEADMPEPRQEAVVDESGAPKGKDKRTDPDNNTDDAKKKEKASNEITIEDVQAEAIDLGLLLPEFEYISECNCDGHESLSLDSNLGDDEVNKFFKSYSKDIKSGFNKATAAVASKIANELAKIGEGASLQMVTDAVFYHLYRNWKSQFTDKQKGVINKWVALSYKAFRQDTSMFPSGATIPDATFSLSDLRTIGYYQKSDTLYMGKFVTDTDTQKRLTKFIKEHYIEGTLPLGNNKEALRLFKESFGDMFKGEEYKLFRIISTTVNKLKNYSAVAYMNQAGVENFIIRGVNDRLQCKYCSAMQGKKFSVSTAFRKVEDVTKSEPEYIKGVAPFITSVYKKPEDMKDLTAEQLQSAGIDVPPYHSGCRDRIIADL